MTVKQLSLNGHTYYIDQLTHTQSRDVFVLLLRNLGPGAGELLAQMAGGKSLSELQLDTRALGRAIQDVCLRLNSTDLGTISEAFGSVTQVVTKGKKLELSAKNQETHFRGALGEWLAWMVACVQWNYADFLELLTIAAPSDDVGRDSAKAPEGEE